MLLAIDTSTLTASVALVDASGRLLCERRDRVTTHSERLLFLVDEVLREVGISARELDGLACGAGPGSFTGLRIGLATAKGLAVATGKPLLVVSSLAALALRAPAGALVVSAIDAFKGEVYAGLYARGEGVELTLLGPPGATSPSEACERVLDPRRLAEELVILSASLSPGRPVHLIGDVLAAWPVLGVPGIDTSDEAPPAAAEIARLAAARLGRGEHDDLHAAIPTYIRPSEAELLGPKPVDVPRTARSSQ